MPSPEAPPGADHQSHDRLLIARLASGDLPGAAQPAAEALRRTCPECASLARDLAHISRATAALPAPRRPRDFRLSPEQAHQARGSIVRRLMERLSAPRLGVLQPLGAAAMAIGFVLVVVGMGLPGMVGSPAAGEPHMYSAGVPSSPSEVTPDVDAPAEGAGEPQVRGTDAPGPEAPTTAAVTDAPGTAAIPEAPSTDSPEPVVGGPAVDGRSPAAEGVAPTQAAASPASGIAGGGGDDLEAAGGDRPGAGADPSDDAGVAYPDESPAPPRLSAIDAADERLAQTEGRTLAGAGLVIIGLLIGLTGLIVIVLRVVSQRIGRDPAIR